jgi:hypothetical protein
MLKTFASSGNAEEELAMTETKKPAKCGFFSMPNGGSGEIRTHGGLTSSAVFKTAAFNRSATLPSL